MIKNIILGLFVSSIAFANNNYEAPRVADFQEDDYFKYTHVLSVEKVFEDELIGEDLYKVNFEVETDECASAGEVDYCKWEKVCEYIWVENMGYNKKPYMTATGVSCTEDIETVLNPMDMDEL